MNIEFYAIKAAGDGEFQKYDQTLRNLLEALRKEKYQQTKVQAHVILDKFSSWEEYKKSIGNYWEESLLFFYSSRMVLTGRVP